MSDPLYAEVPADLVPPSSRRRAASELRRAVRDADLEPGSRTVRWFSPLGVDHAGLRALADMPTGALTFLGSDDLLGAVFPGRPRDIWLSAWLHIDEVSSTVCHELEHSRMLELTGPPRDDADVDAHEFAAAHRWGGL